MFFVTSSVNWEFCIKWIHDLCNYELVTFIVLCAQVGRRKWKLGIINYCHNFLFLYSKRERYSLTRRVEFGLCRHCTAFKPVFYATAQGNRSLSKAALRNIITIREREGVTIRFTVHKLYLAERYVGILCVTVEVTQTLASRRTEFY